MTHPARVSLDALTGLRFVASVGVVMHHFGQSALPEGPLRNLARAGFVGVDLFFIMSGFVLGYVYRPSNRPPLRPFRHSTSRSRPWALSPCSRDSFTSFTRTAPGSTHTTSTS